MTIFFCILIGFGLFLCVHSYISDKKTVVLCNKLNDILLNSSDSDFKMGCIDGDYVEFDYHNDMNNIDIHIIIHLVTRLAYVDTGKILYAENKLFLKLYEIYLKA